MDIINFLAYQRKDAEGLRIERQLAASASKKQLTEMMNVLKEAKQRTISLEKAAGDLLAKFSQTKQNFISNENHVRTISEKNIGEMELREAQENFSKIATISNNLNVIEKRLLAIADEVNNVLVKFEQTKKEYGTARMKYNSAKAQFEKEQEQTTPLVANINKELEKMENGLDKTLLARYKAIRQDKIFPVLVPLDNNTCGGCHMEIPYAEQSKLKSDGYIECEHCRRIIYR